MNVNSTSLLVTDYKVSDANFDFSKNHKAEKGNSPSAIYHGSIEKNLAQTYNQNGRVLRTDPNSSELYKKPSTLEDKILDLKVTSGQPIDKYDTSKLNYIAELAKLSSAAYDTNIKQVDNYRKLENNEIAEMGINPLLFTDKNDGMYAAIFKNDDSGRYVVAFRGSEVPKSGLDAIKPSGFSKAVEAAKDWGNDILQAVGLHASQYKNAKFLAQKIYKVLGDKVTFTGHSLGGGLATIASLSTGAEAYTFNSAAINEHTLKWLGLPNLDDAKNSNNITAFYVKGEPLASSNSLIKQTLNNLNPAKADIIGTSYEIPVSKPKDFFDPGSLHQLSYILNYLSKKIDSLES